MAASSLVRLVPGMLCSLSPAPMRLPIEIRAPPGRSVGGILCKTPTRFLTSRRLAPRVLDSATHVQPAPGGAGCSASPHAARAHASSTYLCTGYIGLPRGRVLPLRLPRGEPEHVVADVPRPQLHQLRRLPARARRHVGRRVPGAARASAYNWGRAKRRHHRPDADGRRGRLVGRNVPGVGSSGHVAYVEKVLSPTQDRDLRGQLERRLPLAPDHQVGHAAGRPGSSTSTTGGSGPGRAPTSPAAPAVGQRLVATAGRWSVSSRHTFQWLADGKRDPRCHLGPLHPRPRAAGAAAVGAGHRQPRGYLTGASTSEQTARVARGRMQTVATPEITGTRPGRRGADGAWCRLVAAPGLDVDPVVRRRRADRRRAEHPPAARPGPPRQADHGAGDGAHATATGTPRWPPRRTAAGRCRPVRDHHPVHGCSGRPRLGWTPGGRARHGSSRAAPTHDLHLAAQRAGRSPAPPARRTCPACATSASGSRSGST